MSINYYNEQTRRNGRINEIKLHGKIVYMANFHDEIGCGCSKIRETMEAANRDMEEHGLPQKNGYGFIQINERLCDSRLMKI